MTRKPDIQYIGQFYIHGSEARQPEYKQEKKTKVSLPMPHLGEDRVLYLEPLAIIGVVMALVLLFTMVVGTLQIQDAWTEYERMSAYTSGLRKTNAELWNTCHNGYKLDEVRITALSMGLVSVSDVEVIHVDVTVPQPEEEPGFFRQLLEEIRWHLECLF